MLGSIEQSRRKADKWVPTSEERSFIDGQNQVALKDLKDKESTRWVAAGFLVLIGDHHDQRHVDALNRESDRAEGRVTIRKGGMFGAGSLVFTGVPQSKQQLVTSAVKFSDKTVRFR